MKEATDLTPADLIEEGRRWVIVPGEYVEGRGFRVEVVFEGHPFRFPIGQITNMPRDLPDKMPYLPAEGGNDDAQREARERAEEWCLSQHGLDQRAYLAVVSSSMRAYEEGKRVRVLSDDPDHLIIQNGFGDEIDLDEEAAIKLYQDLAAALDLPCQKNCPECGEILEEDHCEECDE